MIEPTKAEQLANVGCDIERTIRWRNKGNTEFSKKAFERALELLDFTKQDPKNKSSRRELLIMSIILPISRDKSISIPLITLQLFKEASNPH